MQCRERVKDGMVKSVRVSDSKGFVKVWSQCRKLFATMVGMGLKWAFSVTASDGRDVFKDGH